MLKLIVILLVSLIFEAIGVVLLSHGLRQIGGLQAVSFSEILRLVGRGATNPYILTGVLFEAIFFGALLYLLANADVSVVWPLTSLGFILTTLAAKFFRHEQVGAVRWSGVVLIMMGAALVAWSEKTKRSSASAPPSAAAPLKSDSE